MPIKKASAPEPDPDPASERKRGSGVQMVYDLLRDYAEAQFTLFSTWYGEWSTLPGAVQKYRSDAASQAGLKKVA